MSIGNTIWPIGQAKLCLDAARADLKNDALPSLRAGKDTMGGATDLSLGLTSFEFGAGATLNFDEGGGIQQYALAGSVGFGSE